MIQERKDTSRIGLVAVVALCLLTSAAQAIAPWAQRTLPSQPQEGPQRTPAPITVDQITHNIGNIVTTVDNYGYVGGYEYYGLPSGEWPRNSGHSYIGELKYWMGAILPTGDTVVANTEDDFQALPSLVSGSAAYKILLSTDSARYFDYDPSDTVGQGLGNPAYGWRLYDMDSTGWVYAKNYDPLADTFYSGGPVSLQQSHFRFNDAASGSPELGLELTHTMLQWNYCYNEDFIFVILNIKNTSTTDYTDFAFGLYVDLDVGGPDGTGENGRLGDLVGIDTTENLAWTYDADYFDAGWKGRTGIMGTKYLETPNGIGMTALRTGLWDLLFNIQDPARYALIADTVVDPTLPPNDQYYIMCTRGISLPAGSSVRVVYALIAGEDEQDFRANATLAQTLYDNYYVGPEPPATPTLKARPGNRRVYLSWDNDAEVTVDPLSGVLDFGGYKLYRSENQGRTWGLPLRVSAGSCLSEDYDPLALYSVEDPGDPIPHSLVDTGLYNGVEYWYCLSAFDKGDSTVASLQSGFGVAGATPNVVAVTTRNDPAGYYPASATVIHDYTGPLVPSEGDVLPLVFNPDSLRGAEYEVTFSDGASRAYWHLLNVTTGDTVLARQTRFSGEDGLYPVAEGLRVVVTNGDHVPSSYGQTVSVGGGTTIAMGDFLGPSMEYLAGRLFIDGVYRANYELRYTGQTSDAPNIWDFFYGNPVTVYTVPFEVWNTTSGERVSVVVMDESFDGVWQPGDTIIIVDRAYDTNFDLFSGIWARYSWFFTLDDATYAPVVGDIYQIAAARLNGPYDRFRFSVDGITAAQAAIDLSKIRVVPDPYMVMYSSRVETGEGETVLEFQNIPDQCVIRIYTIAGDLVETIDHQDGSGVARWDLLSSGSQQVASGIYLYHVESRYGEHRGRFAVIK